MSEQTCSLCGRIGVKAFRPHKWSVGGYEVPLVVCSNGSACGMRRANDISNAGLSRAIEARLKARAASLPSQDAA